MMPRRNGYDVIDELRDMPHRPAVIVVTAMPDHSTNDLDPAVVHSIIRKPFDVAMLSEILSEVANAIREHRDAQKVVSFPGAAS